MERKQPVVVQRNGAVHSKQEVDHQGKLNDHIGGQLGGNVFIALPTIRKDIDFEFLKAISDRIILQVSELFLEMAGLPRMDDSYGVDEESGSYMSLACRCKER